MHAKLLFNRSTSGVPIITGDLKTACDVISATVKAKNYQRTVREAETKAFYGTSWETEALGTMLTILEQKINCQKSNVLKIRDTEILRSKITNMEQIIANLKGQKESIRYIQEIQI